MNIPEMKAKHNLILYCVGEDCVALKPGGSKIDSPKLDSLMKLIKLTGLDIILYCAELSDKLHVVSIYYTTGSSFLSEETTRKYVVGMNLDFIDPDVQGARIYLK